MQLPKHFKSPKWLLAYYLLSICIFAGIYYFFRDCIPAPDSDNNSSTIGALDSFYLSIVTITTLGYGDITASAPWLRLLTAFEAIIGIILMGLTISALWSQHVDARDEQKRKIKILTCYTFVQNLLSSHLILLATMLNDKTTIGSKMVQGEEIKIPEPIQIRHLSYIFQGLDIAGNTEKRDELLLSYFESLEKLRSDLALVTLTTDFTGFEILESTLSRLITALDDQKCKTTLLRACQLSDSEVKQLQINLQKHQEYTGSNAEILDRILNSTSKDLYPFYVFMWSLSAQKELINTADEFLSNLYKNENPESLI